MDGDIDVYKHFAWLKRVSEWLLCLGLRGDEWGRETLCGGVEGGGIYPAKPCVAKFSGRI